MKKVLGLLSIVVLGAAGYAGYTYHQTGHLPFQKSAPPVQVTRPAQAVDVMTVAYQAVTPEASFVAKIESREKVGL